MFMDEYTLKTSIETYKEQLSQVELALCATTGVNEDLLQLKRDITEVIQLTEESLLSLRKSQILSSLEDNSLNPCQVVQTLDSEASSISCDPTAASSLSCDPEETSSHDSTDTLPQSSSANTSQQKASIGEDDICGTKCSAPYSYDWGELDYHNALIYSVDPIVEDTEPTVKVFFCHPTNEAMKMCPHFLDDRCWFAAAECRNSHGHSVNVSDLREYIDYDYSVLVEGSSCLAKHSDGIWYKASVIKSSLDTVTIQYQSYSGEVELELHSVIPTGSEMLSSDEEDNYHLVHDEVIGGNSNHDNHDKSASNVTSDVIGTWEHHTKGIGSKIMRQMGYKAGQGLGKDSQGRVEPVPIKVLPAGKSLDKVIQLQAKTDKELIKTEKDGVRKESNKKFDVFEFLNKKIGHKKADVSTLLVHNTPAAGKKTLQKATSKKETNIQLLKTQEEIKNVKRKLAKLNEALSRNTGRDKKMTEEIKKKKVPTATLR